jgi:hypothetical protein
MSLRIFEGKLTHQNPTCTECNNRCYTLYFGGKKDMIRDLYFCKKCQIIYKLPTTKKCDFRSGHIV